MNLPADRKVAESETGYDPWPPGSTEKHHCLVRTMFKEATDAQMHNYAMHDYFWG